MFDILVISFFGSLFLTFFIYLSDSVDSDEETIDVQKHMKNFFISMIVFPVCIYIFSLFYKSDIDSMSVDVDIPNF